MIAAVPWGEAELFAYADKIDAAIDQMLHRGVALSQFGSQTDSTPDWKVSQDRAAQMRRDLDAWLEERVTLPDHRAEAIAIVYTGMVRAGVVPSSARRAPRAMYRG